MNPPAPVTSVNAIFVIFPGALPAFNVAIGLPYSVARTTMAQGHSAAVVALLIDRRETDGHRLSDLRTAFVLPGTAEFFPIREITARRHRLTTAKYRSLWSFKIIHNKQDVTACLIATQMSSAIRGFRTMRHSVKGGHFWSLCQFGIVSYATLSGC